MKHFFETSESTYPATKRRIPEKWNPLVRGCENRKNSQKYFNNCENRKNSQKYFNNCEKWGGVQNDAAFIVSTLLLRQRPYVVFIY